MTSGPPARGRPTARSSAWPASLSCTRTTRACEARSTRTWREAMRTTTAGLTVSFGPEGAPPGEVPGRDAGVPSVVTWIDPFMFGWIEQMKS